MKNARSQIILENTLPNNNVVIGAKSYYKRGKLYFMACIPTLCIYLEALKI